MFFTPHFLRRRRSARPHLRRERVDLREPLKPAVAGSRPSERIALAIRDGHDGVVETRLDMPMPSATFSSPSARAAGRLLSSWRVVRFCLAMLYAASLLVR